MHMILSKYIYSINFVSLHHCKGWTTTTYPRNGDPSLLFYGLSQHSSMAPPLTTRLQRVPSRLSSFSPWHPTVLFPFHRLRLLSSTKVQIPCKKRPCLLRGQSSDMRALPKYPGGELVMRG